MRVVDQLTEEEQLKLDRAEHANDTAHEELEEAAEAYEEAPATVRRYRSVIGAVRAMMSRRRVDLARLTDLSDEERDALAELREAIEGRRNGNFYFAEDRLEALNEVLAVLQPILSVAMLPEAYELRSSFDRVRDEMNALRERLSMLDAVEDEQMRPDAEKKKDDEDDDDDDDDDEDGEDGDEDGDDAATADAAAPVSAKKKKTKPADDAPAGDDEPVADDASPPAGEPTP